MDDKIRNLLEDKPLIIPRCLFNNYHKLNISEEELVVLIYMIDMGNKIIYNPEKFMMELSMDKFKVMEIINRLVEKQIIGMTVEKNSNKKREEFITLDLLYQKLVMVVLDSGSDKDNGRAFDDVFSLFEAEFGRCLSPMEIEIIKEWINQKFSYELIYEALKEATYNGANSLRYIDKVLFAWKNKGIMTKDDVMKDKMKYRKDKKEKEKIQVFDYNWLDDSDE